MSTFSHIKALLEIRFDIFRKHPSAFVSRQIFSLLVVVLSSFMQTDPTQKIMIAIWIPMIYGVFVRSLLVTAVHERSENYREYFQTCGMNSLSYQWSFVLYGYLDTFFTGVINLTGMWIVGYFSTADLPCLILAFILYGFATTNFIMVFSTLFTEAKIAGDLGSFVFNIISVLFFFVSSVPNLWFYQGLSLFPQVAIALAVVKAASGGAEVGLLPAYTIWHSILALVVDFFAYLALYFLLDLIIPSKFGIRKRNSLNCFRRAKNNQVSAFSGFDLRPNLLVEEEQESVPNISSAIFHEKCPNDLNKTVAVRIDKLTKFYDHHVAVNGFSLSIYEKEIFCLLGHNGAGKTTAINILTGLLKPDSGEIYYKGKNFVDNYEEVKNLLSVCTQSDIMFSHLTVQENLHYIGVFRGMHQIQIDQQVQDVMRKVGIQAEKLKLAAHLSGGTRRKLCLAMALMGNPKIIFLDEMTSGLDPVSRRTIWKILIDLKNDGKSLIFTTHHLDEADHLADRIGLMTRGNLFTVGSSDFIKKHFGVGYQLSLISQVNSAEFEQIRQQIITLVKNTVPESQLNTQSADGTLTFTLPFTSQSRFSALFKQLEGIKEIQIGLEMNTLEDAFINIGLDEDKFLSPNSAKSDLKVNIDNIAEPECLSKAPTYTFLAQYNAMIYRKWLSFRRSPVALLMFALPIIFIVFAVEMSKYGTNTAGQWYTLSLYIIMGFAFSGSSYCGFSVSERESGIKYALKVMGCRTLPYWLGTFTFDFGVLVVLLGLFLLLVFSLSLSFVYANALQLVQVILLFLGFMIAAVTQAYRYGFGFKTAQDAYRSFFGLAFGAYMMPQLLITAFIYFKLPAYTLWLPRILGYYLGPGMALQDGFYSFILTEHVSEAVLVNVVYSSAWIPIVILYFEGALYMALTLKSEAAKYKLSDDVIQEASTSRSTRNISNSEDIRQEKDRMAANPSDRVKVLGLKKVYPNSFLAIKNTSFGVEPGQIFGLLGPNGAGKSTTFGITTALLPKTAGSVKINDIEVNSNIYEIFQEVGVCPQFDCLWDNLSVVEHLSVFGRLKGLNDQELKESIEYYIRVLSLDEHRKKNAKGLSGGNKRKLCVAIALIGSPQIQFFDEPSTGLDPLAKRYLWACLTKNLTRRNASIVLTTHSMNEAESLCHKIGIMINGEFVCLGSTQHLKSKYGNGYKITLKTSSASPSVETLQKALEQVLGKLSQVLDASHTNITFQIFPISNPNILLERLTRGRSNFEFSSAFSVLQKLQEEGKIDDFSIYNTTLEQVFIQFSKFQVESSNVPVNTDAFSLY